MKEKHTISEADLEHLLRGATLVSETVGEAFGTPLGDFVTIENPQKVIKELKHQDEIEIITDICDGAFILKYTISYNQNWKKEQAEIQDLKKKHPILGRIKAALMDPTIGSKYIFTRQCIHERTPYSFPNRAEVI